MSAALSEALRGARVLCLCANWCGTCTAFRPVFDELSRQPWGVPVDWVWADVEDQAEALGHPDIENFPTLVVLNQGELRFAGPVLPHLSTVRRLVQSALAPQAPAVPWPQGWEDGDTGRLMAL